MIRILLSLVIFWPVAAAMFFPLAWAAVLYAAGRLFGQALVQAIAANVLVGIDQLYNAVLGGDVDMTISDRMGRAIAEGRCRLCGPICWMLDRIDPNHCHKYREADESGAREVLRL